MFDEYPEVLNVDEACEILRIGRNNFYRLLKEDNGKGENKLRAFRNGRVCFPRTFLASRRSLLAFWNG